MDVTISKSGILWCCVLLISCVLLGKGLSNQARFWEASDISELNAEGWEYGDYVKGEITTFIKDTDNRGCSGTYDEFHEYTIPLSDGKYALIYAGQRSTQKQLNNAHYQDSFSIPFIGVLKKDIKYSVYSGYPNFHDQVEGFDRERIIPDLVILQTTQAQINNTLYLGAELFVICMFLRILGVLPPIIKAEKSWVPPTKKYTAAYCNPEFELESEIQKIEQLQLRLVKLKKDMIIGMVLFLIGLVLFIAGFPIAMWHFGFMLMIVGIPLIWWYVIHLDNKLGHFCTMFIRTKTIPKQIAECRQNIQTLRAKIERETAPEPIRQEDDLIYADF
ncbi:MAG: hypothetical protein IKL22_00490 [Lachnospiraceae bacterium]|nr:hypothetical protein [Lachnospiraceae bacterium]